MLYWHVSDRERASPDLHNKYDSVQSAERISLKNQNSQLKAEQQYQQTWFRYDALIIFHYSSNITWNYYPLFQLVFSVIFPCCFSMWLALTFNFKFSPAVGLHVSRITPAPSLSLWSLGWWEKHAEVLLFLPVPHMSLSFGPRDLLTNLSTPPWAHSPMVNRWTSPALSLGLPSAHPLAWAPVIKDLGLSEQLQPKESALKPQFQVKGVHWGVSTQ